MSMILKWHGRVYAEGYLWRELNKNYGQKVHYYCPTMRECIREAEDLGLSLTITDCMNILEHHYGKKTEQMKDNTIKNKILILLKKNLRSTPLLFEFIKQDVYDFLADWRVENSR